MTDLPEASAAGQDVTVGGRTYRIGRLDYGSLGEFTQWVRSLVIDAARRAAANTASPDEKALLLDRALERASRITLISREVFSTLREPEAMVRLAWLALRRHQPDLTLAEVYRLCADPATMETLVNATMDLNADLFGLREKKGTGTAADTTPATPETPSTSSDVKTSEPSTEPSQPSTDGPQKS